MLNLLIATATQANQAKPMVYIIILWRDESYMVYNALIKCECSCPISKLRQNIQLPQRVITCVRLEQYSHHAIFSTSVYRISTTMIPKKWKLLNMWIQMKKTRQLIVLGKIDCEGDTQSGTWGVPSASGAYASPRRGRPRSKYYGDVSRMDWNV